MGKDHAVHPLAETYPPMSEAEMEALTADIAARGLQRPIVLYEGMILDGRNRYLACKKAGVEPSFVGYEGDDPLGQVNSLNLNRDLTAGQRAIIAARQWGLDGYSKGGRPSKGKPSLSETVSVQGLARQFRVGKNSIAQARDLLSEAPDLAIQVESCTRSLANATEELQSRRDQAKRQAKDAEKASAISAEYRELISDGRMTSEEAVQEIVRREAEEADRIRRATEARQIWFEGLTNTVKWIKEWVASRSDEYLAWYTEDGSPETGYLVTTDQISECIVQLGRIKTITLRGDENNGESGNGKTDRRSTGSPKDRARTS